MTWRKGTGCLVRQKSIRVNAVCVWAADALLCASVQWHFHITVSNATGSCSSSCRCVCLGSCISLHLEIEPIRGVKCRDLGVHVHHGTHTYMPINKQGTVCAVIPDCYFHPQVATAIGWTQNGHLPIWSFPAHPFFPSCLHSIPSLLSRSLHLPRFPNSLRSVYPESMLASLFCRA